MMYGKPKAAKPKKPAPKKGMAMGGMAMVNKDGKKVPAFAADGIGKMAYGGMTKKGYNKGGMANCGASMKPAQGKGK